VAEAREWRRQRLQARLQQLPVQSGGIFPLHQPKRRRLTLQSESGEIAHTVTTTAEVDEEIRDLFAALENKGELTWTAACTVSGYLCGQKNGAFHRAAAA